MGLFRKVEKGPPPPDKREMPPSVAMILAEKGIIRTEGVWDHFASTLDQRRYQSNEDLAADFYRHLHDSRRFNWSKTWTPLFSHAESENTTSVYRLPYDFQPQEACPVATYTTDHLLRQYPEHGSLLCEAPLAPQTVGPASPRAVETEARAREQNVPAVTVRDGDFQKLEEHIDDRPAAETELERRMREWDAMFPHIQRKNT